MREDHQLRGRARFGVFELDLCAGELRKHGLRVRLQEEPFQVLAMRLGHPGKVVAREELQKKLWPQTLSWISITGSTKSVMPSATPPRVPLRGNCCSSRLPLPRGGQSCRRSNVLALADIFDAGIPARGRRQQPTEGVNPMYKLSGPYGVISRTKSRSSSVFKSETARNSNAFFFQEKTLYP